MSYTCGSRLAGDEASKSCIDLAAVIVGTPPAASRLLQLTALRVRGQDALYRFSEAAHGLWIQPTANAPEQLLLPGIARQHLQGNLAVARGFLPLAGL